jgi:signal transduction histidine kinase
MCDGERDCAALIAEKLRLVEELGARTCELTEALEQQTATSEILRVISTSPANLQPVLNAVAESAARLCNATDAQIYRVEGEFLVPSASYGQMPRFEKRAVSRGWVTGRAVVDRRTIHVHDLAAESESEYPIGKISQIETGHRTTLATPLVHDGVSLGAILIRRMEVCPFTDKQIKLLENFADQAVLAIENTRLFEELQARTRELTQALEDQTATSEVLGAISRSPTDAQPVFDMIAQSAARLCKAQFCHVFRFDGQLIHFAASHGQPRNVSEAIRNPYPIAPGRVSAAARSILSGAVEEIPNIHTDTDYQHGHLANYHSIVAVPMLKGGRPIGAIALARAETGRFPERQIELLRTFANQAVIAIENTRLFEEVQARNSDLKVALEQQTATSELFNVIGRSTFDLQPVFDTLAENAIRLCEADRAMIFRFDGQNLQVVAAYNISPELRAFHDLNPIAPGRGSCVGRMALERRTIHIHDVRADPEYTFGGRQVDPYRTLLAVPMLKAGELLGAINIVKYEVLPFTESQIALMETFSDQAVIAIENTRLFEEVQALGEVGRAVSSTLDLKVVLKTIVDRAVHLSGTDGGSIFYYREEVGAFELGETSGLEEEVVARFGKLAISVGETGLGEAIAKRQPLQVPDVTKRASNPLRDAALEAGLRAALIVPLVGAEGPLGALVLQRRQPGEFSQAIVSLMQTFADQSAIAIENAHLFEKIAQKGRELELASQHKSQFVANMSHELRTPLAAILGYAELMQEGFYGELPDKSMASLTRIRSNGKHLLGLINTVLDIAKIEAGQFSLSLAEYALDSVVETVRVATESLSETKKLSLKTDVGKRLPVGLGDEQRLTQVLLNLVGNAIKFTDTGEVRITATAVNGHFSVAVTDTGSGIPPEELKRVFEPFHQIDNSNTKAKGGTGLGLAIAKQIVEMHGGRIWVESTLGKGATFQMELPIRAEFRKGTS